MGKDISAGSFSPVSASVIDRNQREAIQSYSKNAHFQFTAHRKSPSLNGPAPLLQLHYLCLHSIFCAAHPTKSTHDTFFHSKDNSVNVATKDKTGEQTRTMKASHFSIGKVNGDMVSPKPIAPIEPVSMMGDALSAADAKKRLGQASWTTGQSPMKYESIQQASFYSPGKTGDEHALAQKQLFELKSRISSSSVMNGKEMPRDLAAMQYQTYQHAVHKSFGEVTKPDPALIAAQKLRLSKSNFFMGGSPAVYTSTNLAEHQTKGGEYIDKNSRLTNATKNQKTNFVHHSGFEKSIGGGELGPQTHKGQLDQDQANVMMNHLKASHFILGKD